MSNSRNLADLLDANGDVKSTSLDNVTTYTHPNHSGDVTSTADGATVISAGAVDIAMLSATGTAGATNFLRGDNTWVVPTDTVYTHPTTHATADIADNAITEAKIADAAVVSLKSGRKNLIINGGMEVAQRGNTTNVNNTFSVDRFKTAGSHNAVLTTSQQVGATTTDGYYKNYLQLNVDTANTPLGATQYATINYKVEDKDFSHSGFGTSGAKAITLSFHHAHSVTGTYSVSLRNAAANRNYLIDYTQSTADAWEKTTVTITADTAGDWVNSFIMMDFTLANGSAYSSATSETWFAGQYYHSTTNQINLLATVGNKFRITGVQLELGSVATDFEHRSYGEELALCQRYYENSNPLGGFDTYYLYMDKSSDGGSRVAHFEFNTTKRTNPTIVTSINSGNLTITSNANGFRAKGSGAVSNPSTINDWEADAEL